MIDVYLENISKDVNDENSDIVGNVDPRGHGASPL